MTPIIISIIALVISCFSLAYTIYKDKRSESRKLKIENKGKILANALNRTYDFYCFDVTNIGKAKVHVDKIQFHIDSVENKFLAFTEVLQEKRTPLIIDVGGKEDFSVSTYTVNDALDKYAANKIRLVLIDIHGKHFKSNWFNRMSN